MTRRDMVWGQVGAAIDMLENAIRACPDELWAGRAGDRVGFWYIALHAIFFLVAHATESEEGAAPALADAGIEPGRPHTAAEVAWAQLDGLTLPERPYTRDAMLAYLARGREVCRAAIAGMTDVAAQGPCGFPWMGLSRGELLLYTLRNAQHHAGQLSMRLRDAGVVPPDWVRRTAAALANGGA